MIYEVNANLVIEAKNKTELLKLLKRKGFEDNLIQIEIIKIKKW